ncbi:hypothetical protein, partial [Nonomuraea sp. WAC 01424]|uniref:hypothetical protein n=1 Tax=Nonomuraea sp. WAC 01424 TaxID=2203200 RepID=UPI001C8C8547
AWSDWELAETVTERVPVEPDAVPAGGLPALPAEPAPDPEPDLDPEPDPTPDPEPDPTPDPDPEPDPGPGRQESSDPVTTGHDPDRDLIELLQEQTSGAAQVRAYVAATGLDPLKVTVKEIHSGLTGLGISITEDQVKAGRRRLRQAQGEMAPVITLSSATARRDS